MRSIKALVDHKGLPVVDEDEDSEETEDASEEGASEVEA